MVQKSNGKVVVVCIAANQRISFTQKFKFSISQCLFIIKKIKPSKISIQGNNPHMGSITPLRPKLKKKKNPANHTIWNTQKIDAKIPS